MFYNGSKLIIYVFAATYVAYSVTYSIVIYRLFSQYSKISFNDSLEFLCIISSPVYTLFFLSITIIMQYVYKIKLVSSKCIIMFILCSYFFDVNNCESTVQNIFKTAQLNLNLQNGLLNIHPYIIFIIYGWIFFYIYSNLLKQKCFLQDTKNTTSVNFLGYLVMLGVLLGAWWAAQEYNWGGFWSWDPVELISLLLVFFIIRILHKPTNIYNTIIISVYFIMATTIYFIMRLGIISTIHAFIKNLNMPFYAYILFIFNAALLIKSYCVSMQEYSGGAVSIALIRRGRDAFLYILIWSLSSTLLLLVCLNLNIVSNNYIPPLNLVFPTAVFCFLTAYPFKRGLATYNVYATLCGLVLLTLDTSYLLVVFLFLLSATIFNKNKPIIHFIMLWGYLLYTFFFITIAQYPYTNTFGSTHSVITDYHNSANIPNHCENNIFFKKKYYFLSCKAQLQHILSFSTISNNIITYFVGVKNNRVYLMYAEEITMFIIYLFIVVIAYNFRWFYNIRVHLH